MRVVIGEDSVLFREGLGKLLVDAGHEVVGAVCNAREVVDVDEATSASCCSHSTSRPGTRWAW